MCHKDKGDATTAVPLIGHWASPKRRGKHQQLKREQRLLNKKLEAMKAGDWGLESMFSPGDEPAPDPGDLAAKIDAVESELLELGAVGGGLEQSLEQLAEVLAQPAHWLYRDEVRMRLTHMGIKTDASSNEPANDLRLIGLFSAIGERRIVLPVRLKWSDTSGHRVKAVKCHNEVRNDNRNEKETELHGRFQAGCRGAGNRTGLQDL